MNDEREHDGDPRMDPPVALKDWFRGRTPGEWRALYANAYDWDADVGREVVED